MRKKLTFKGIVSQMAKQSEIADILPFLNANPDIIRNLEEDDLPRPRKQRPAVTPTSPRKLAEIAASKGLAQRAAVRANAATVRGGSNKRSKP